MNIPLLTVQEGDVYALQGALHIFVQLSTFLNLLVRGG